MEDKRIFMKKGDEILLCREGSDTKEKFTIISFDGAGASSVCYNAKCGKRTGRLKEFYPSEYNYGSYISVERSADCQINASENVADAVEVFDRMMNEYLDAYHTLRQVKNDNNENKVFNTFIPAFEIYRGVDKMHHPAGSAYIWTADNDSPFQTFEQLVSEIHKNPEDKPEKNLFVILTAINMLTECIKTIHCAGLLHCDIKPSNFGSPIRNGRYLTEQLSLFDVNSIYSVYSEFPKLTGTVNFCAPEVIEGEATNQSDIYSIGATLFNAVIVGDSESDSYYDDEMYPYIRQMVASSKLISASELNSNLEMQDRLAGILEKCLSKDLEKRYICCDDLMNDLKKTIVYLLPYEYGDSLDFGDKLVLVKAENMLRKNSENNPTFAIQSFLFDNPLYDNAEDGSEEINILILGFGVFGQKFLDLVLQVGQMNGRKPNVTVLSADCQKHKQAYFKARPAMQDFFDVDSEKCGGESYGSIKFVNAAGAGLTEDSEQNAAYLKRKVFGRFRPDYILIALADDAQNYAAAEACEAVCAEKGKESTVGYILSRKNKFRKISNRTKPIFIFEKTENIKFYNEIERMAFNSHLLWKDAMNIDYRKLQKEFSEKYYHDSSVANVLSIKYKLHSLEIELKNLDADTLSAAAEEYRKKYLDGKNEEKFAQLVAAEHRRWVVEKITAGWTCRSDYEICLDGNIHDSRKKEHPCIVRCAANTNLEKYYKKNDKWIKKMWDRPCDNDSLLDGLDTVSVMLHRTFYQKAKEIKNENILEGSDVRAIKSIIGRDRKASVAFNEWIVCLKKIWSGDERQTQLCEGLRDAFLESVKGFQRIKVNEIKSHMEIIDAKAFPVINSLKMRDYKSSDVKLIKAIPFILTYSLDYRIAVPFRTDGPDIFDNVSAATLINPSVISYVYYITSRFDLNIFEEALKNAEDYMNRKSLRAKLNLYFVHKEDHSILDRLSGFEQKLYDGDKKGRIKTVRFISVDSENEICPKLRKILKNTDAFEKNGSRISKLLEKNGFFDDTPYYVFNSADKSFSQTDGCVWLNYINRDAFLSVPDMLVLRNSKGTMDTLPSFDRDYKKLWRIYKDDVPAWKALCRVLREHSDSHDTIASFDRGTCAENKEIQSFIVPFEVKGAVDKIMQRLAEQYGVIGRASCVQYRTTDSCEITVDADEKNRAEFEKLISNPYLLLSQQDIEVREAGNSVSVTFNSLLVNGLDISGIENSGDVITLLKKLKKEEFISNLIFDGRNVSFTYSERQIKNLLTYSGRILEIYIYHSMLDSGLFSDVVSVYNLDRREATVKQKLDCIVTSGFRSLIIECKTHPQMRENFYNDFSCFAENFGINSLAVIVFDTPETEKISTDNQCENLITVSNPDEIEKIADTLNKIIN